MAGDPSLIVPDASPKKVQVCEKPDWKCSGHVGFRVLLCLSSHIPCYFLLTVVPVYAYCVGDLRFPNLMVSDLISAGPVYRALFTFSLCYNTYGVSMAWTECMRCIKARAPALTVAADRFLLLFHGFGCPSLLLLCSFMFDLEGESAAVAAEKVDVPYWDTIPTGGSGLITWAVHVLAASLFFLVAAVCAIILGLVVAPHLHAEQLMHPKDLAWMALTASGIAVGFVAISIFRFLHIFHSTRIWIWPLAITEVLIILMCLTLNSMGTLRLLADLDRQDPIVDLSAVLTPKQLKLA
mmetsp:Transcript_26202/g.61141  ORF Transcript_26202/g.61141 Transcript_26202/m.61141 type:complete len:295 (-) Transcript_26202:138-1022(-)